MDDDPLTPGQTLTQYSPTGWAVVQADGRVMNLPELHWSTRVHGGTVYLHEDPPGHDGLPTHAVVTCVGGERSWLDVCVPEDVVAAIRTRFGVRYASDPTRV